MLGLVTFLWTCYVSRMDKAVYRENRKLMGLTQAKLAECLGLDRATIIRRESGESPINREAMFALAFVALGKD